MSTQGTMTRASSVFVCLLNQRDRGPHTHAPHTCLLHMLLHGPTPDFQNIISSSIWLSCAKCLACVFFQEGADSEVDWGIKFVFRGSGPWSSCSTPDRSNQPRISPLPWCMVWRGVFVPSSGFLGDLRWVARFGLT